MVTLARKRGERTRQSPDAGIWLVFAASPVFAMMAWVSANDMRAMTCAPESIGLPIGGMPFMYLLMALFHLPPWVRLGFRLSRENPVTKGAAATHPNPRVRRI